MDFVDLGVFISIDINEVSVYQSPLADSLVVYTAELLASSQSAALSIKLPTTQNALDSNT